MNDLVVLDRDGVINHDKGYTHKFSDFKFRKNVINFLSKISKEKRYIFIITNQGGIAKNKYTLKNFQKSYVENFINTELKTFYSNSNNVLIFNK